MDRRVPRATWVSQESPDRRGDREIQASRAPLDSQDPRVFQGSKERRVNLELTVERGLQAWPARMGLMARRASWAASDLLAARETLEPGALTGTPGRLEAQASGETKVPRGTPAAQDAEGLQETLETKEARVTKATMEPRGVLA